MGTLEGSIRGKDPRGQLAARQLQKVIIKKYREAANPAGGQEREWKVWIEV